MKRQLVIALFALVANAQTAATIQAANAAPPAPAAPGKLTASANTVICAVTGNAVPAKALLIACTVNGSVITPYFVTLPAGASTTINYGFGQDGVTLLAAADAAGAISIVSGTAKTAMGSADTPAPVKF